METFVSKGKLWMNNAKILTNRPYNTPEPSVTTSFQANSVDHKLFPKGRLLRNFVVSDTFYQLLFKQVGRVSIRIAYKQLATELL
ncbi:hypothetical protein [Nostoc sp.]|uniref:hypothetical protein n=1 Tax=Nostoc sp. TaxID=1180 RepID=UPI003593B429